MVASPSPSGRPSLDAIHDTTYDVIIVGGGIAGAGVARDAAMRGLDTLLVEKHDFGWATTAWSTRLAHGGLRYLEHLEFGLVFESLQERETIARLAPHLVEPVRFLIPQYRESIPYRLKLRAGMVLYDLLSYGKSMPRHRALSAEEVRDLEPSLPEAGLQGGFLYHDRQISFVERLCLETVMAADAAGADVLNHAEVTDIRTDGSTVAGVTVADGITGTTADIDSRTVLNAAGPWADTVLDDLGLGSLLRPAKGIHLVLPRLTEDALTLPTTDGRVFFIVPWAGKSLVGTTDTPYEGDPGEARATREDVEYLLGELNRFYPSIDETDIIYTYAGVRPLYDSGDGDDTASVSREHEVIDHGPDYDGLFSLVGAKITPYRAAAEEATDAIATHLGVDADCRTATNPLPGGRAAPDHATDLPAATVDHLDGLYGSRAAEVIARAEAEPELAEPVCDHTDDILAQVATAIEDEYAHRLTDVVFRRCTVGFADCEGRDAVETITDYMATALDWDDDRYREELDAYEQVIERRQQFRDE